MEKDNVVKLSLVEGIGDGIHLDANELLEEAKGQGLTKLVIVGILPEDELWVSCTEGAGEAVILMERAKLRFIW